MEKAGFTVIPIQSANYDVQLNIVYREIFGVIYSEHKRGVIHNTFGDTIEMKFELVHPSSGLIIQNTLKEEPYDIFGMERRGAEVADFEHNYIKGFGEMIVRILLGTDTFRPPSLPAVQQPIERKQPDTP